MGTSEDVLLKSVLHKLIIGLTDWTDDELQFYSNNHTSIEQKLELNDYPEDVFVTSANLSCVERSIITKELGVKRIISKPEAILLALYSSYIETEEKTVAIVAVENNSFDMGLFCIGDGIVEELGFSHDDVANSAKSCEYVRNIRHDIDNLFIVHNGGVEPYIIKQIEAGFKLKADIRHDLPDLLIRGAYILSGVLCGIVRDCILIQLQQFPLYCELGNGDTFELLKPGTCIPARKETIITTRLNRHNQNLWIREKCNEYHKPPVAFVRLQSSKSSSNQECKLKITLDIDTDYQVQIKIVDLDSNQEYNIK